MAIISSQKILELARAEDPKQGLIDAIGVLGLDEIEVFGENLLVGTYIRPEKTKGGVIRPESNVREDEFQGNVGLVLKVGNGILEGVEDILYKWVLFGYNDGLKYRYNDVAVRIISIDRIRAVVVDPTKVL